MMTKVLVFGTGAVGSLYAWLLEKSGTQVTAVCRSNYAQVHQNGLLIRSKKWGTNRARPVAVASVAEAAQHGPFDYILMCSKAFPGTCLLINHAVTPETAIVLAQNGIGIEEEYAQAYPNNTIISGVVYLPVVQVEPGIVEHGTPLEQFEIGTYPANASAAAKEQAQKLVELWKASGATCLVYEDIQARRWSKLAVNATFNSICALTLCDDGNFLRSSSAAADMARDVMREVGQIAQKLGYDIVSEELIEYHMARHLDRIHTGGKQPSMQQDVEHGRPIEVEVILGNAVKIAETHCVNVPFLRLLYVLLRARNFSLVKDDQWKPIATVP